MQKLKKKIIKENEEKSIEPIGHTVYSIYHLERKRLNCANKPSIVSNVIISNQSGLITALHASNAF